MRDRFECRGVWFTPQEPEKRVFGVLTFTPDGGANLALEGYLHEQTNEELIRPEIILGVSSEAKRITLFDCFQKGSRKSHYLSQIVVTSSFFANIVFVGVHFKKKDDIRFKELSIRYLHLDEWVGISGFSESGFTKGTEEVVIKHSPPSAVELISFADYSIYVDFVTYYTLGDWQSGVEQRAHIKVESPETKSFRELRRIMRLLQFFLTLGIGKPVYPTAVTGLTNQTEKGLDGEICTPSIEVLYTLSNIVGNSEDSELSDFLLFTLSDISERSFIFLKNWFEKAEILKPVYTLYFGTLNNAHLYWEHTFLSFAHAAETYHRRTRNNFELPKIEHKDRLNKILNTAPIEYKHWLKEKLAYSNEVTFRARLEELCRDYSLVLDVLIPDKEYFISKVVNTRNYLTHYNERLKSKAAEEEDLRRTTNWLRSLLEVCLLAEIGFTVDEIWALISRRRKYLPDYYE